jgi:hypothetical protein
MKAIISYDCRSATILCLASVFALSVGCSSTSTCSFGQEVVIPNADATKPSVVMDVHLPNGNIVTLTPGAPPPPPITVPNGSTVTLIATATDPDGAQAVQIMGDEGCSGGLLGRPMAESKNNRTAGEKACTQILAQTTLLVNHTPFHDCFEVLALGFNFGAGPASREGTTTVKIKVQ